MKTRSDSQSASSKSGRFALLVAAGILLSRISGLIREKIFAHFLGNSLAAGVFKAALRIPNMLQNLFGEGVLSASFIPVYTRLRADAEEEVAGRVAGAVVSLLLLTASIIVLLGVLLTPVLLVLIAPGFTGEARELAITVVRILFPGVGVLVLGAWCQGILNSHHRFFLSYVAPVLWNMVMIAALYMFGGHLGQKSLVVATAWAFVIGSALQFAIQIPTVLRHERHLVFALFLTLAPVRQVLKNFVPVVVGRGVVQISAYLDGMLASLLGPAAVSGLAYAQTIYLLPVSLFGMSVAAAELPQMSSIKGSVEEIHAALRGRLQRGLHRIAFFVVPSMVAFLLLGQVLVATLYQGGKFGEMDTRFVWYVLAGSTVGLLAVTFGRLYASTFYALNEPKVPLRFAIIRVLLTGVLGFLFAIPLRPLMLAGLSWLGLPLPILEGSTAALGSMGLTASAGMAGWVEFILLRRALDHRIGPVRMPGKQILLIWISALLAGGAGVLFKVSLLPKMASWLPRILVHVRDGLLVCAVFGLVYLGLTLALGIPEARGVLRRFRHRGSTR